MAAIDSELFLELFTLETMPACDIGMQLAENFLEACGHAVEVSDREDEQPLFLAKWAEFREHKRTCGNCLEE